MAYTSGNLFLAVNAPTGKNAYRYDTTDHPDVVEGAGYFNNKDDDLILAKGDTIVCVSWTAVTTGTISYVKAFVVTNVIANTAAANAGAVNIAEWGISSAGALSSGT